MQRPKRTSQKLLAFHANMKKHEEAVTIFPMTALPPPFAVQFRPGLNPILRLTGIVTWLSLAALSQALAGPGPSRTVTENIFFIKPDGKSYLNYRTTRSGHDSYNLFLRKSETEGEFDYIYPNDYVFDEESDTERNVIAFKQGSYATLRPGSFAGKIVEENGFFSFANWDENRDVKLPGGFYGEWTAPDDFAQYVYAWVMPDNLEVVSFETNHPKKGVWRLRRNTLAWYGQEVNNIIFKIKYRAKNAETARALRASLSPPQDGNQVTISTETSEVRVMLSDQVLFPSGSAELSDTGRQVLDQLAKSLKEATENHFIVEGHTDNSPLAGPLAKLYPSNWELSSARSLSVVRHLQAAGITGDRLESRAYGEFQPVASNDTPEGRAENRRIEIRIISTR